MGAVFIVGLLQQTEGNILSQTKLNEHDFLHSNSFLMVSSRADQSHFNFN